MNQSTFASFDFKLLRSIGRPRRDSLAVSALDQRPRGRGVGSSPLAAGCRVATV